MTLHLRISYNICWRKDPSTSHKDNPQKHNSMPFLYRDLFRREDRIFQELKFPRLCNKSCKFRLLSRPWYWFRRICSQENTLLGNRHWDSLRNSISLCCLLLFPRRYSWECRTSQGHRKGPFCRTSEFPYRENRYAGNRHRCLFLSHQPFRQRSSCRFPWPEWAEQGRRYRPPSYRGRQCSDCRYGMTYPYLQTYV